jgi:NADH-quinone oxidoreductase E subunit
MKATSHRAGDAGGFAFTPESMAKAEQAMACYPEGRKTSAILALLDIAQRQSGGWLSGEAIEYVANLLEIAPIRAHEVASFYSMFNLKPVGRHLIQVCRTTPCWLCGSDDVTRACLDRLGTGLGETTADGLFTVVEVECLGACANAPMVQINDDYYEDLTPQRMTEIIADLAAGKPVPTGSQTGRLGSCAASGPTTLLDSFGEDGAQAIDGEGSS